ncbi:MAG: Hsp20/alpha crystallin family protein [Patescibacteria group bacterium]
MSKAKTKVIVEEPAVKKDADWLEEKYEGQLAIDVYQTPENIVIKSTIAGVQPEDIDVTVNNDMVTIRGSRQHDDEVNQEDYYYQECYWGNFSRSIILPVDIDPDNVKATIKNGVLTVTLTKLNKDTAKRVAVDEEEDEEEESDSA